MTKKQMKESKELIKKIWDKADELTKGQEVTGEQKIDCEITYIDWYHNETVTERTKCVRWDGAIITESNHFLWGDMDRVLAVNF